MLVSVHRLPWSEKVVLLQWSPQSGALVFFQGELASIPCEKRGQRGDTDQYRKYLRKYFAPVVALLGY